MKKKKLITLKGYNTINNTILSYSAIVMLGDHNVVRNCTLTNGTSIDDKGGDLDLEDHISELEEAAYFMRCRDKLGDPRKCSYCHERFICYTTR